MIDLWDLFQQGQIDHATSTAEYAKRDAASNSQHIHVEVQRLDAKIDRLAIICQALWELVRENTNLTESDIEQRIKAIDARDGRIDGKITGGPVKCPKCARPGHTRNRACAYCGAPLGAGLLVEKP